MKAHIHTRLFNNKNEWTTVDTSNKLYNSENNDAECKKPDNEEYILCNSTQMKLKNINSSVRTESRYIVISNQGQGLKRLLGILIL